MKAVVFDGRLRYVADYPRPQVLPGWARIRVHLAGICRTDLEIIKGYKEFKGILGHEFTGTVENCQEDDWTGQRVVGEINIGCAKCSWCARGMERHCRNRRTLGIVDHDGCMADYCVLPTSNLCTVDPDISDERAVLTEPLAAACEILDQISVTEQDRIIVLGDGRLGILCAWVLTTVASKVTVVGHHEEKLAISRWRNIETVLKADQALQEADIIIEATGSGTGITQAVSLCRPRGTVVLKSTPAVREAIDLTPVVINEITVVGSRCGRFKDALDMMRSFPDMPLERLITKRYPLHRFKEAFESAAKGQVLKVLLDAE